MIEVDHLSKYYGPVISDPGSLLQRRARRDSGVLGTQRRRENDHDAYLDGIYAGQ